MGLDLQKALNTTGVGSYLIPSKLEPLLTELAVIETPLLGMFKEIPWSTNVYTWNERSALISAAAYNETDTFSSAASTYSQNTATIKMVKADGEVTNLLISTSADYIDALRAEIESATRELSHQLERYYIVGNVGMSAKEFNGLSNLVTATYSAASTKISLNILDGAINTVINAYGKPNLIVLNTRDVQELWNSVRSTTLAYFWKEVEQKDNYLSTYRGIPIIGSHFVPKTNNPNSNQSIGFVLDTTQIVVPVNKGITYEDMTAKVTTDNTAFRLKTYRTFVVKGGGYKHCKITGIAAP
jgi:hypothetical protein